jgi:hypothetical protein
VSAWGLLRTIYKIMMFPITLRVDWHKVFTGEPNPRPAPAWNIYDAFAQYIAGPVAFIIVLAMIPWIIFQEFTRSLSQVDQATIDGYVGFFCVLVFVSIMVRKGYLLRALRWSFGTPWRTSAALALVLLSALTLVALAEPHAH